MQRRAGPIDLNDNRDWWQYLPGPSWKRPDGPDSNLDGLDEHPVVHVADDNIEAYASWAGKEFPTEAEWEFAGRGGLEGAIFAWGDEHFPAGQPRATPGKGSSRASRHPRAPTAPPANLARTSRR